MSQGLGSILSPKGKLVHPRLRVKHAHPRHTAFEAHTEEKRHQPRLSLPDMGEREVPLQTSASVRALPKASKASANTAVATLGTEQDALRREIAELQQIVRGGKIAKRREKEEDELRRELKQERIAVGEARKEVEVFAATLQKVYRNALYQDEFEADIKSLKLVLERSTRRPPASQLAVSLNDLLKRSYHTLSGWKRALS